MYFKKIKLFNSETLDSFQLVKIAELLWSSIVLWNNVFLEWKNWTWKTQILHYLRDVSELEIQIFNARLQARIQEALRNVNNNNPNRNDLRDIFWWNTQQNTWWWWDIDIEALIRECTEQLWQEFSTFNQNELEEPIMREVPESTKMLYEHIRTNFPHHIFSYIDLSKISENALLFNDVIDSNIKLSKDMWWYKTNLVIMLDNLSFFNKQNNKDFWLVLKEFFDKWITFILTWNSEEKLKYTDILSNLDVNELDLSLISDQISQEILESHEWLKRDHTLSKQVLKDKVWFLEFIKSIRTKYKKNEPFFTNEILIDLFNSYQKEKTNQIQNKIQIWEKFNFKNLNLSWEIQWFDIKWNITKKYQENSIYTPEKKEQDIEKIKKVIIWQDEQVEWSLNSIFLWKWFNKNPIASLLYLWPTWVWKTELSRQIAKAVFDDENKIKVLQMNTYTDQWTSSRLIWSGPWYVWYEDWKTQNLKAILENMWEWVVVFDEIEKAHSSIFDFLMWIMWDWKMQMASWLSKDNELSFKNFVIIFTSNAITSYKELEEEKYTAIWFDTRSKEQKEKDEEAEKKKKDINSWTMKEKVIEILKNTFKPEFLWRIDQFFLFNELTDEQLWTIIRNYIEKTKTKLKEWIADWLSPFKVSDIDSFLYFDDSEINDIILFAKKTKLWARNAIKKTDEIIWNKMNFHFTWKVPHWWTYKVVDDEDNKDDTKESKRKRKSKDE